MNQPAAKGRGVLFALLAGGALLASCCSLGVLMVVFVDEEAKTVSHATAKGEIPTGETPELFPGSPGWLPSGRGSVIPDAELNAGEPQGLWWYPQLQSTGVMDAIVELYLPDGTYALRPRPGGPFLFDLEGHRRAGSTVGTFTRDGDDITRAYDRFSYTEPFSNGEDDEGRWFNAGVARRRPIAPVKSEQLTGTWESAGSNYEFRDDGTVTIGINNAVAVGTQAATWKIDGYLMMITPNNAPSWIQFVGSTGNGRFLVLGNRLYSRR